MQAYVHMCIRIIVFGLKLLNWVCGGGGGKGVSGLEKVIHHASTLYSVHFCSQQFLAGLPGDLIPRDRLKGG